MEDVTLYVNLQSLIPALKTPTDITADAKGKTITVIWEGVENAESYKVTCGDIVETTGDTCYEFTVSEDGLYEISVVATTSDASFKDSAPATTTVRVGAVKKSKAFFSVNGQNSEGTEYEEGTTISFPSDPSIEGVEFMGWTRSVIPTPQAAAPDFVNTKSTVMGAEDITFYAVFATKIDGGISWVKKSLSQIDSEGVYALLTTDGHAFNGTISSSGHGEVTSSAFSFTDNIATSAPEGICELTFIANGTGYKMYNASKGYLYAKASSSGNLEWHKSETSYWSNKSSNWTYESNNAYLRSYNNTFRTYGNNNGAVLFFAQKITKIIFTDYCTNVVTLSSIAVSGTPTKTEYTVGDAFDPAGLTVTGTYSDGTTADITDGISWNCAPATFTAKGSQNVSVTATVKNRTSDPYVVSVNVDPIKLEAPANLTCTAKTLESLTFTWDKVANATGYQVSLDGTNYLAQQSNTYTCSGLAASTNYTLYVKAVGDESKYSASDATSAEGKTLSKVTDVTLDASSLSLDAGETAKLTATVSPDDAANKEVTWSSNDPTVATVAQNGLVTAVKAGKATITATSNENGEYKAICDVTVNLITTTITPTNKTISVGATLDVSTLFKSNSNAAFTYTLEGNPESASLNGTEFSATAAGTYIVKASQDATTTHSAAEETATITVITAATKYVESFSNYSLGADYKTAYGANGSFVGKTSDALTWSYTNAGNYNQASTDKGNIPNASNDTYICLGAKGTLSTTIPSGVTSISFKAYTSRDAIGKIEIIVGSEVVKSATIGGTSAKADNITIENIVCNGSDAVIKFSETKGKNRLTIGDFIYMK